jgi:hypothetical protein
VADLRWLVVGRVWVWVCRNEFLFMVTHTKDTVPTH